MSPFVRLRRPILTIAFSLATIVSSCRSSAIETSMVEPTAGPASSLSSPAEAEPPGAPSGAGAGPSDAGVAPNTTGEVRAGLDPLAPDVRYRAGAARAIGGWSLARWERLPGDDAGGFSGASTGLGDLVQISRVGSEALLIHEVSSIDPLSGSDINGDGQPEAVIRTWSGGAHCCYGLRVYSLGEQARPILAPEPSNCDGRFEDLDGDGRLEYLSCDDAFAYAFCPFAFSPLPRVVLRYDAAQGAYVPATPDFAPADGDGEVGDRDQAAEAGISSAENGGADPSDGSSEDPTLSLCESLAPALDALYAGETTSAWQRIEALGRSPNLPQKPGLRPAIEDILDQSPYYLAPGETGRPVVSP